MKHLSNEWIVNYITLVTVVLGCTVCCQLSNKKGDTGYSDTGFVYFPSIQLRVLLREYLINIAHTIIANFAYSPV